MFEVRRATDSDKEAILSHMSQFFCNDEPMCEAFGKFPEGHPFYEDLTNFMSEIIQVPSNSILVFDGDKLIAVSLNDIKKRNEPQDFTHNVIKSEEFQNISNILEKTEHDSKLLEKFPDVNQIMYVVMLSVDKSYRGKGLAKTLVNETRKLAKTLDCGVVAADCSSYYSSAVFKNLGFDMVYRVNFNDYQVDGKPYFKVKPIHRGIEVYAERI